MLDAVDLPTHPGEIPLAPRHCCEHAIHRSDRPQADVHRRHAVTDLGAQRAVERERHDHRFVGDHDTRLPAERLGEAHDGRLHVGGVVAVREEQTPDLEREVRDLVGLPLRGGGAAHAVPG